MEKRIFSLVIVGMLFSSTTSWAITKITKVEFLGKSEPNQIIVSGDGPIEFEKTDNSTDHQVILEIKNARLANPNVGRRLDASSFNSKVSLISPYNVEGQNSVRVIIQMREDASTSVVAHGNKLFMGVDGEPDTGVMAAASEMEAPNPSVEPAPAENIALSDDTGATSESGAPTIKQFTDAQSNKQYVGRKITLQFRDAPVVDVFRLIGETSGFNIVLGPDVTGNITLSLVDVPWDLALDTVLSTMKLGAERTGSVMRVASLTSMTQEKQQILAAKAAAEASAPRVTRIFPISYATPASLVPLLQKFGAGSAGSGAAGATRADSILVDERTNSLVIQDVAENIDRMAKIIELMDRPTPQVLIEAKIVEASEEFSKDLSGSLGTGTYASNGRYFKGFSRNGDTRDPLTTAPLDTVSTASPPLNQIGMGFKISSLANFRLNALLNLNESESKLKVISSPRTVVLNKQKASIIQGTPVLVPTTTLVNQVPVLTNTVQSANLSLGVTPTVTNDGNILMDLNISSDTPKAIGEGQSGIGTRNITTNVVTESGSTLVIGGVYTQSISRNEGGIPFLRKIPILGLLFGSQSDINNKSELFIFITPRVLNEKDSSIASDAAPSGAG